jgi:signal transduction histidine kinase
MPEVLLENGLGEALNRYCSSVSNYKLNVNFVRIGESNRYPPNYELSLYRIAQELIGNVIKHANATQAFVQLSAHQNMLSLKIEDNGSGFDANGVVKDTGLKSIRKRVAAMTGYMDVRSEPGKGTSIYLEFER